MQVREPGTHESDQLEGTTRDSARYVHMAVIIATLKGEPNVDLTFAVACRPLVALYAVSVVSKIGVDVIIRTIPAEIRKSIQMGSERNDRVRLLVLLLRVNEMLGCLHLLSSNNRTLTEWNSNGVLRPISKEVKEPPANRSA